MPVITWWRMGFKILLLDITIKTHNLITNTKTRKKVNYNFMELFCLLREITHILFNMHQLA